MLSADKSHGSTADIGTKIEKTTNIQLLSHRSESATNQSNDVLLKDGG
jgi:hypothetical protein